jgi:hypothetical protein
LNDKQEATGTVSKLDTQAILDSLAILNQNPAAIRKINRIVAVIALLTGSLFLTADLWWLHRRHFDEAVLKRGSAQGQIVENKSDYYHSPRSGRDLFRGYRARVRFRAESGRSIVADDWYGTNPPAFTVGQSVTVFYDPELPEHAVIDHGWKNYLAISVPLTMGLLMLLGGVQRLLRLRATQPHAEQGPPRLS